MYPAAQILFERGSITDVIRATYARLFVDEYQDCTKQQHKIIVRLAEYLPVVVLGDPLQGLFDFQKDALQLTGQMMWSRVLLHCLNY